MTESGAPQLHASSARLSASVAALMAVQAVLGLLFPGQYRDVAWIRATWWGNDWVTLALAVPMLLAAMRMDQRGSVRGRLILLGLLGYGIYNYAFYLFGAALNVFFALYVALFVTSLVALGAVLARTNPEAIADAFPASAPTRAIGGYFVFVAVGLSIVWLGMWAAFAFAGRPTPVEPEAFQVVAALDLSLMVPALGTGGVLLWRRRPWGFVVSATAGVQGALYLLVLTLNAFVAIRSGQAPAPGEVPIWGTLAAGTTIATAALLRRVR
jgi:hypothetical protein